MDIWERMQTTLNQGLEVSKDLFDKAKDKARDLGEKGMTLVEIKQLESNLKTLTCKLGARVYQLFSEGEAAGVCADNLEIMDLVGKIRETEEKITEREKLLKKQD